jgi:hypothetical protein
VVASDRASASPSPASAKHIRRGTETTQVSSLAIGVAASHRLPERAPLCEPLLIDAETDRWAAVAAGLEIAAAAWLGWRPLALARANGYRLRPS